MPDDRRTRPRLLREVQAEVASMLRAGERGPARLLRDRLAARGVRIGEATLRSGNCRELLERVWVRRPISAISHGPTGGHDLRPVAELVEHVLDLRAKIARVEADLRGEAVLAAAVERDRRSLAVLGSKEARVAERAALIPEVIRFLAGRSVDPSFARVAEELTRRGSPISSRQLRRREEYTRPILKAQLREALVKPAERDRGPLLRLSSEELGAMVYRLLARLREVNAEFEAGLD